MDQLLEGPVYPSRDSLRFMNDLLSKKRYLVIFPEGWRRKVHINIGLPIHAEAHQNAEELAYHIMAEISQCCAFG